MSSVSKNLFSVSKLLVALLLVVAINIPVVARGEENAAVSTPESIPAVNDPVIATTTLPVATTTDEFLPPASVPEEEAATTTGEVLGESAASETEEDVEENIEEEDFFDQTAGAILSVPTIESPSLSVREFKRRVVTDKRAFHSCEAEVFRIDISGKASARVRIALQRDSDAPYEIEIGGLPQGIDVMFSKNSAYRYTQGANDRLLELAIENQSGSQKGDFTVPIIYTQKGTKDSSVICQINIINL